MSAIRRLPVVLGLTMAVLTGGILPASAAFSDSATVATEIKTFRVQEATSLSGQLTCGTPATMSMTWQPSTTARIAYQQVKVYFSDGSLQTVDLGPTATSWSGEIDVTGKSIEFTVTAVTDFGWFKESSKQGQFHC